MSYRKEIRKIYSKQRDEKVFQWFEEYGLDFLIKRFDDEQTKLTYRLDEDGIRVTMILKDIMILGDYDMRLLKVLRKSASCSITAGENGMLKVEIWFRGWKWVKNEGTEESRQGEMQIE